MWNPRVPGDRRPQLPPNSGTTPGLGDNHLGTGMQRYPSLITPPQPGEVDHGGMVQYQNQGMPMVPPGNITAPNGYRATNSAAWQQPFQPTHLPPAGTQLTGSHGDFTGGNREGLTQQAFGWQTTGGQSFIEQPPQDHAAVSGHALVTRNATQGGRLPPSEDSSKMMMLATVAEQCGRLGLHDVNTPTAARNLAPPPPFPARGQGEGGLSHASFGPAMNSSHQHNSLTLPPLREVLGDILGLPCWRVNATHSHGPAGGMAIPPPTGGNLERPGQPTNSVGYQVPRTNPMIQNPSQLSRPANGPQVLGTNVRTVAGEKRRFSGQQNSADIRGAGNSQARMASTPGLQVSKRPRTTYNQDEAGRQLIRRYRAQPFNIFQAMVFAPYIMIGFTRHLRVQELLTLYSSCWRFYTIVNLRLTNVILYQALQRAPESAKLFPFRCYRKLCMDDPAKRLHPNPQRAAAGEIRKVPSFRWLRMVCFREMVCHEIVTIMGEDGVPVLPQCEGVLKKIWLLMDIPDTKRRVFLVKQRNVFSDLDLFFATLFFIKLDMRFTDPITGSGKDGMRRLLMAQPGLTMLWRTLKRTALLSRLDVLKLFIRWKYHRRFDTVLGIPPNEIGIMRYESWGRTGSRVPLLRPDELIMKEAMRRGLKLERKYADMFLGGYVDPRTLENIPPVRSSRRLERMEGWEEDLIPRADRGKVPVPKRISTRILQH